MAKLLKLPDAIYNLDKCTAINVEKKTLSISFEISNACSTYEFETEEEAMLVLEKCYEFMLK